MHLTVQFLNFINFGKNKYCLLNLVQSGSRSVKLIKSLILRNFSADPGKLLYNIDLLARRVGEQIYIMTLK